MHQHRSISPAVKTLAASAVNETGGSRKMRPVTHPNFIQRKCADCAQEDEEKVHRKPMSSFIQMKTNNTAGTASESVSNQINENNGNGQRMDNGTRSFMQTRFGADFNTVNIHTGNEATFLNRELNAKAFTVGNDIYFNEGQYQPSSNSGKHLLAHELTHVVQQSNSTNRIQTKPKKTASIRHPKLSFYQADDHAASFFKGLATTKAREIGAVSMPVGSTCPETVSTGPTPYFSGKEIVNTLTDTKNCTGKPVEEIHIFSHGYEGGGGVAATEGEEVKGWVNFALSEEDKGHGAVAVADVDTESLSESAVFVFHGCQIGAGDDSFAEMLLKHIVGVKTKAKVYAHRASGVCGRKKDWIEFNKDHQEGKIRGKNPYHKEQEVKK